MAAHQEVSSLSVDITYIKWYIPISFLGLTFVDFGAALDKFPQTRAQDDYQAMPQKRHTMSLFTY